MTVERSRLVGQAMMAASGLTLALFAIGALRRSYAALALPVAGGLALVSGLAFWVGYTMATTRWEDEIEQFETAAEGAPPPETVAP